MKYDERRPGLDEIARRLATKNPSWSRVKVAVKAKIEWHKLNEKKESK